MLKKNSTKYRKGQVVYAIRELELVPDERVEGYIEMIYELQDGTYADIRTADGNNKLVNVMHIREILADDNEVPLEDQIIEDEKDKEEVEDTAQEPSSAESTDGHTFDDEMVSVVEPEEGIVLVEEEFKLEECDNLKVLQVMLSTKLEEAKEISERMEELCQ